MLKLTTTITLVVVVFRRKIKENQREIINKMLKLTTTITLVVMVFRRKIKETKWNLFIRN